MISEATKNQLLSATDRHTFIEIADFNGLKTRESLKAPVLFAYENGDYKNRLTSANFCVRCGTSNDIVADSINEGVCFCKGCNDKRNEALSAPARPSIFNDPYLYSDRDVPEHVLRGEQFEDKLAMFRNEI